MIAEDSNIRPEIEAKVRQIVADSLCVDLAEVSLNSNLMRDLNAESIDFLDIMFRLENEFSIKIPQREIEHHARGGMTPEEFEVDTILQPKGIKRLQELLPEIAPSEFKPGISLRELPGLFTVKVFCGIVQRKLDGVLFAGVPLSPGASLDVPPGAT
jgi:acyl carrier protein